MNPENLGRSFHYKKRKQDRLIKLMRHIHRDLPNNKLLNLSFRNGDPEHSQWPYEEECNLLPLLVAEKKKPIAGICHHIQTVLESIQIPKECKIFLYKNRWNMSVLLIYHRDDKWLNDGLIGLYDHIFDPFDQMGQM